jgi:hypothetical protein
MEIDMKFGRHLIAAAVAVTSTSALAGFEVLGTYTIHEITDAKLKATFVEDGKTKTENINKKDLGSLLCGGRELDKKEKLALYAPCPAFTIADTQTVFMGVYDRDTGDNACNIESLLLEEPQIELKDNAIQRITALFFGDFAAEIEGDAIEVGIFGALDAKTKFVKDNDLVVDGLNCFHKVKTKSLSGAIEEVGEDDAVITSGKLKVGKVKDTILGSEIEQGLCGIDCEL